MRSICLILLTLFSTPQIFAGSGDFFPNQPERASFTRSHLDRSISTAQNIDPTDCRARIKGLLCLVNSPTQENEVRKCLPGGHQFAKSLEATHDLLPPQLQKVFCSLQVIFVENEMESLAYAGTMGPKDDGAAFMGIRKSLLANSEKASQVFAWKEQKAFGFKNDPFKISPKGPQVRLTVQTLHSTLQYIVAHEFGHILDFANNANSYVCKAGTMCDNPMTEEKAKNLIPVGGSWGDIGWENMVPFYEQLLRSSFHTTYSAVSPWEDFAENMAFHVMAKDPFFEYRIDAEQFQYLWEVKWTGLTEKRKWIENFLARDLNYPKVLE